MPNIADIQVQVVVGDVREFRADVLVLKYARYLYGADGAVHGQLTSAGIEIQLPEIGDVTWCQSKDRLAVPHILFVGVNGLAEFGYGEIRDFSTKALSEIAKTMPDVGHVALTLHGPGYGLDEIEAFRSELAGIADAIELDEYPRRLKTVSFVEQDKRRAVLLGHEIEEVLPGGLRVAGKYGVYRESRGTFSNSSLESAGHLSAAKPHVFVAMPLADDMDDLFHYGIQGAVRAAGLLCERADFAAFTGDVMEWVKGRISSSTLVIAELTTANPNVYLEVGFAWGRNIPTVLLLRENADRLKFDTRGQRCLVYKTIQHLEEILARELQTLVRRQSSSM